MSVASAAQPSGTNASGQIHPHRAASTPPPPVPHLPLLTCRLWIQSMYVYSVSPLQTSLVYLQKPANLGHPVSPSLQKLMSSDTVCTARRQLKREMCTLKPQGLPFYYSVLCSHKSTNSAVLIQIRLGQDAESVDCLEHNKIHE